MEARHNVGHLHAGVVDIVLHFHVPAARAQHAHEGIAQHRIAKMTDMRGLVGINIGVFDNDLAGTGTLSSASPCKNARRIGPAIQPHVDIAVAGHFERALTPSNGFQARH